MKKNKIAKVLIFTMIFSFVFLGLFLCVNVFAEEEPTTVVEATEVITTSTVATTEQGTIESFVDWVKQLNMADVKGWAVGLVSYLFANLGVFLFLAIKLIMAKSQQLKEQKFYQELTAKMDENHKKQMNEMVDKFNAELEDLNKQIKEEIKRQNSEKRELAKNNVQKMKEKLDEIKLDLESN